MCMHALKFVILHIPEAHVACNIYSYLQLHQTRRALVFRMS